ncbi:hypothetical protein V8B97DRAFT_2020593 [Scleroderma yunnanense]
MRKLSFKCHVRQRKNGKHSINMRIGLAALRARSGADLFPNLRSITCFLAEPGLADEKLLPLSLKSLELFAWAFEDDIEGHRKALVQLSSHTPHLERLTLRGVFHFVDMNPPKPLRLKHLREVVLTRVLMSSCDFQYLCHLLCASPVAELSICLREPLIDESHSAPPLFPFLRRFVFCGNPVIAHGFLERLASTTLLGFSIEHEDCVAQLGMYKSLLGLLHKRFSNSLKSLHLNFGRCQKDVHVYDFLANTLMALRPLVGAGLEELRYSMSTITSTLPEELQQSLDPSSWPGRTEFSFSTCTPRLSDRVPEQDMIFWALILERTTECEIRRPMLFSWFEQSDEVPVESASSDSLSTNWPP